MVVLVVMGVTGSGKTTVSRALAEKIGCGFADADNWHSKSNIAKMRSGVPLTNEDRLPWLEALHDLLKGWEKGNLEMDKLNLGTRKDGSVTLGQRDDIRGIKDKVKRGDPLCKSEERKKVQESKELTKEDSLASEERVIERKTCHTQEEQLVSGVLACSALKQSYREILMGTKCLSHGERCGVDCVFVVLCGSEEVIRCRLEGRQGHYMDPFLLRSQLDTLEVPTEDEVSRRILVKDLTMSVEAIANYVLQRLSLLLMC